MEKFSFGISVHLLEIIAAVIYPYLRQLEGEFNGLEDYNNKRNRFADVSGRKRVEDRRKVPDKDVDRDDECGICMENCTKMVLPNCGHSMCITCFHNWYHQLPFHLFAF